MWFDVLKNDSVRLKLLIANILLYFSADFGMDDREMMRDASTFEEDIMHGATASNLLLEAEPGPANLPDKSNHMEYDDFGDGSMGNSDGGMLGERMIIFPPNMTLADSC